MCIRDRTRKTEATTCLSRSPRRARSARPTATCHGVGKMVLPLSTTAACHTTTRAATGASSGSHPRLALHTDIHGTRRALEAVVDVPLVRDPLANDAGLQRGLHQVVQLGPDQAQVGVGHPVPRIAQHVPDDAGALVE